MTQPTAPPIIVGIDPGGRSTGIVARHRTAARNDDALIAALVVERPKANKIGDHGPGLELWVADVLTAVAELTAVAAMAAARLDLDDPAAALGYLTSRIAAGETPAGVTFAAETVRKPSPHARRADGNSLTNLDGILATAAIVGAIVARWPATILIEPGRNGAGPRGSYPSAIDVPAGGRGADRNRHARSAYDVASASLWTGRLWTEERNALLDHGNAARIWAHRPTPSVGSAT